MANIPTTDRAFYDRTPKSNTSLYLVKDLERGVELYDQVETANQNLKIESALNDAKNEIMLKNNEYRNIYQSDPDSKKYKQDLDAFSNSIYSTAREKINPLYRNTFDQRARELTKKIDYMNQEWAFKQNGINVKNDISKLGDSLLTSATEYGKNGDIASAEKEFDEKMKVMLPASNLYFGSETSQEAFDDMKKEYLSAFAEGAIEQDPFGAENLLKDKTFREKVGGQNIRKLDSYMKKSQNAIKKEILKENVKKAKASEKAFKDWQKKIEKEQKEIEKLSSQKEKMKDKELSKKEKSLSKLEKELNAYEKKKEKELKSQNKQEEKEVKEKEEREFELSKDIARDREEQINNGVFVSVFPDGDPMNEPDETKRVLGIKIDEENRKKAEENRIALETNEKTDALFKELKSKQEEIEAQQDIEESMREEEEQRKYGTLSDEDREFKTNYEAETDLDGSKLASDIVDDFLESYEDTDENDVAEQNRLAFQAVRRIKMLNSDGVLSDSDANERQDDILNVLGNRILNSSMQKVKDSKDIFEKKTNQILEKSLFESGYLKNLSPNVYDVQRESMIQRMPDSDFLSKMSMNIINKATKLAYSGDYDGAEEEYKKGLRELNDIIYPEIRGKNVGDVVSINGIAYEIKEIGEEVFFKRLS